MKGNILVSSPSLLSDTVFYKSIILIIDDSDNSHTGFILNKPGGLFFIKNESGKLNRNYKFNFGGPVSEETFFIIKNHNLYSQNFKINENLFWGNDVEMVINEIENGESEEMLGNLNNVVLKIEDDSNENDIFNDENDPSIHYID